MVKLMLVILVFSNQRWNPRCIHSISSNQIINTSRIIMSCHVMSCHYMSNLLPLDVIFSTLLNHTNTFKNVRDIINSSFLYIKLLRRFLEV